MKCVPLFKITSEKKLILFNYNLIGIIHLTSEFGKPITPYDSTKGQLLIILNYLPSRVATSIINTKSYDLHGAHAVGRVGA